MDKQLSEFLANATANNEESPNRYLSSAISIIEELNAELIFRTEQFKESEACISEMLVPLFNACPDPIQSIKAWHRYKEKLDNRAVVTIRANERHQIRLRP